ANFRIINPQTELIEPSVKGTLNVLKASSPGTKLAARGLSVMCNSRIFLKPFEHLAEGILDGGEPFRKAHGKTAYELVAEEPEFNNSFNLCMADHSKSEFELRIGLLLDLVMMVNFNGKERTFEEYQALAEQAGFNKVHLVNVSNGLAILEFHK
ncbi:hypothetical protein SELMODRAFT_432354, partial [Selaginella moellendorffii]